MKPYLLVALVGSICVNSCGGRIAGITRENASKIEELEDVQPVHLDNHEGWSEEILTVYNCIKNNGTPREMIQKGDTLTLVYGQDSTLELVFVRDTLYCEIMD